MTDTRSAHAVTRFGLGAKAGELLDVRSDPLGWLNAQLEHPVIPKEVLVRVQGGLKDKPLNAFNATRNKTLGDAEKQELARSMVNARKVYAEETGVRLLTQLRSEQPFIERLVLFWSNHFTVSVQKGALYPIANAYEVEAIRPHVTGYFSDMLLAVCRHPAMLVYLDQARSFGPNSPFGMRRGRGLNENLAREILELHTLGVNGGYGQDDVIALAKIITGWTLKRGPKGENLGDYQFLKTMHEPGDKILLGRRISESGEQEGIDALTMLAEHPSTARFIATKLVRHFIADEPPAAAIDAVAKSFMASGGHLATVMRTLIALKDAWNTPLEKIKTSYEFAVSALRLTGIEPTVQQAVSGLEALNFKPFNAGSPAGYDDVAAAWAAPDAIIKRIEWGYRLAQRMPANAVPIQLAEAAYGDLLRHDTRLAIERAASGRDGIGLLLASPEFQRR